MFPENEFWQCPSYTWSSFLLSIIVGLIIALSFLMGESAGSKLQIVGGLFMLFWMFRTLYHWIYPDPRCEAKGFPGQHYINPFYSPPEAKAW